MKKTILLIAAAFTAFTSFAGGNNIVGLSKKGEGVLSNGFYLNIGVGFPSSSYILNSVNGVSVTSSRAVTQNYGVEPHLEIGNQWYFWHNDKVGVGIKVSWLQFGVSSAAPGNDYIPSGATNINNFTNFHLKLIKLAPQFSYAINEDMALDATFEVAPTIQFGGYGYKDATKLDNAFYTLSLGALFAPGVRFRYKVFAAGFDYSLGTLASTTTWIYDGKTQPTQLGTITFSMPRVYLGFQF